jgi:ribosome-associated protein
MAEGLRINNELSIPMDEIQVRASRSSGPGGQHANVTASRIEVEFNIAASPALTEAQRDRLRVKLGGDRVRAVSQDTRSQARNRDLALERLREKLVAAMRQQKPRRPTKPSKAADERRLEQKRRTAQRKAKRRRPSDLN